MSEPYLGEIKIFSYYWPPRSWAGCNGQLLPISQNSALFSLLGTNFGGDGRTTFAAPDLRGRAPMHWGTGPGLTTRPFAYYDGYELTNITVNNLPPHNHNFNLSDNPGDTYIGNGTGLAAYAIDTQTGQPARFLETYDNDPTFQNGEKLVSGTISSTGGGQKINNMQPYLVLNYCIAMTGIYPSRN